MSANLINDKSNETSLDLDFNLIEEFVEFRIEFNRITKSHLTKTALGGSDPFELLWTLEIE